MANVENLEKRLKDLINKSQNHGSAIALTGEWGIGKTHFWKNFYKKYHDLFKVDKYAYVSLFGLDNLGALKYQIAINTHNTTEKNSNPICLKKFLSKVMSGINLPKIESSGFSLTITQEMINNHYST